MTHIDHIDDSAERPSVLQRRIDELDRQVAELSNDRRSLQPRESQLRQIIDLGSVSKVDSRSGGPILADAMLKCIDERNHHASTPAHG